MEPKTFEYFPMGNDIHILEANTFEDAIREARILNKAAGILWAGLNGLDDDDKFLAGKVTESGFSIFDPDDED